MKFRSIQIITIVNNNAPFMSIYNMTLASYIFAQVVIVTSLRDRLTEVK